tara:strand:+ start:1030 stop:1254 length:225 start_codon:yes stop_codon:yes gene_type:complete
MLKQYITKKVHGESQVLANRTEAKMPNKDESKIFSVKNILLTVGAIVALKAIEHKTKPKEAKPVKLNFPKEWNQ